MDVLVIALIMIVTFGGIYLIANPPGKNKKNKETIQEYNDDLDDTTKTEKEDNEKVIETKTINYMEGNTEKELSVNVIEKNDDILKISNKYGELSAIYNSSDVFYHTPNAVILGTAGMIVGEYDSCINKNHLCILGREGMYSDYYIDINNITKVDVSVYVGSRVNALKDEGYYDNYDTSYFWIQFNIPLSINRYDLLFFTF